MMTISPPEEEVFDTLVSEGVAILRRFAPQWTNYNASDPAITLIELLAFVTDALLFQTEQIGPDSKRRFLGLLSGSMQHAARVDAATLNTELEATVARLRRVQRAVTPADFELLVREALIDNGVEDIEEYRVKCFPGYDLSQISEVDRQSEVPGRVSVVVVPPRNLDSYALTHQLQRVSEWVRPKCLLGTHAFVVAPTFVRVDVAMKVRAAAWTHFPAMRSKVLEAVQDHFGPCSGEGGDGSGWAFGRPFYLSELHRIVAALPEISDVTDLEIHGLSHSRHEEAVRESRIGIRVGEIASVGLDTVLGARSDELAWRLLLDKSGALVGIGLLPHELLHVRVDLTQAGVP
jgi:hypothetical protein